MRLAIVVSLLPFGSVCASQPTSSATKTNLREFTKHIAPFLKTYCVRCHGAEKQRAKFAIHDIDGLVTNGKDTVRWEKVLEMLSLREMPPPKERQPSAIKRLQVVTWIKKELRKIGRGPKEDLAALPGYGNRVDHEALFNGEHKGPSFTKSRVWRISPYIYQQFTNEMQVGGKVLAPLKDAGGTGFKDFASLTADEATIRTMLQNSKRIAKTLVHGRLIVKRKTRKKTVKPSRHKLFTLFAKRSKTPPQSEMEAVVRYAFQLLLQRQPSTDELQRYVDNCLRKNIAAGGADIGIQSLLIVLMMSPEFLFRMEMGLGEETEDGRRMLAPREIAYALSFAIFDYPVKETLNAAVRGKLSSKDDVAREVRRLLASKDKNIRVPAGARKRYPVWEFGKFQNAARPKILRFFREFFGYEKAMHIFKDDSRHGGAFQPTRLIGEADLLILNVVKKDKDVFAQLLTTDEFFVGYFKTRPESPKSAYASLYNLEEDWDQHQILKMPKAQRAGILTHPAWIAAFSTNFENDPVRRGKWIQERLLANVIPDIPIGVAAQLPDDPHQTLRQRFQVVRKDECWRCHKKMNPLGETFEMYDDFGRYRTKHFVLENKRVLASELEIRGLNRGKKKGQSVKTSTKPIDSSGRLEGAGDPTLNGTIENAIDLVHRLAKSKRVRQSFIRHAFRYWMGRNETLNDSPTLMAMDRAYCENGGSFNEMLVALFTSDSFLYRK